MTDTVLARLAEIKTMDIGALKGMWRDLYALRAAALQQEVPREPAGLSGPGTRLWRAEAGDAEAAGGTGRRNWSRAAHVGGSESMPVAGTRLLREWQGVEHTVTVLADGFDYDGRPYKSLSAIARAITGTRWNGWLFFGLRKQGRGR